MNKVYVLIHGYRYINDTSIVAVYSNESIALREMFSKLNESGFEVNLNEKTADNGLRYYKIEEHEVAGGEK